MPQTATRRLHLPPGSIRRSVPRWVGTLAALAIFIVLGAAFGSAYWDGYRLRREAAEMARERDLLRRQNAQLREEIRLLNTPEYIERIAREQLSLVRPGEIAIMLMRPTPAPTPLPAGSNSPPEESWLSRLLHHRSD